MSNEIRKPCIVHRCPAMAMYRGKCAMHSKQSEQQRGTASERGYGSRWRKARDTFLSRNPLCQVCEDKGRTVVATQVHHTVPHRGNQEVFWKTQWWQAICHSCHSKITWENTHGS